MLGFCLNTTNRQFLPPPCLAVTFKQNKPSKGNVGRSVTRGWTHCLIRWSTLNLTECRGKGWAHRISVRNREERPLLQTLYLIPKEKIKWDQMRLQVRGLSFFSPWHLVFPCISPHHPLEMHENKMGEKKVWNAVTTFRHPQMLYTWRLRNHFHF